MKMTPVQVMSDSEKTEDALAGLSNGTVQVAAKLLQLRGYSSSQTDSLLQPIEK